MEHLKSLGRFQISDFRFQGSTEFLKKTHADYKNEISDYKTQEMWRYGTLQISDFKQADYNLGNEMSTTQSSIFSVSIVFYSEARWPAAGPLELSVHEMLVELFEQPRRCLRDGLINSAQLPAIVLPAEVNHAPDQ